LHTKTRKEAQATECAADLGGNEKFWALTDKIYETTTSNDGLDLAGLPDLAAGVGLNKTKFKECLDSDKYKDKIQAQYEEANKAGIRGAPYNVIIGPDGKKTILPGAYPFESFKNAIDAMLKK
jgi:protein-disulfide isomerase